MDDDLTRTARLARDRAYAPYSGFRMGAAVVTDDGTVVPGVLVENVSLGLAMCAERVAMFSAVALGLRPVGLALVAPRTDDEITMPCGACLQVALELGGPQVRVVAADANGDEEVTCTVGELLPKGPRKSKGR